MVHKIRYMSPGEEESIWTGFHDPKTGDIALRKGYKPKEMGRTLRHEIGHLTHPVDEEMVPWINEEYENPALTLFRELCALYYALSIQPRDPISKDNIKLAKEIAVEEDGLSPEQVSRADKVARERVGYTGREVR